MKVLLAGANGQLGKALLAAAPSEWAITPLTRAEADLADTQALERVIGEVGPDLIVNASAYTAVDKAESDDVTAHKINVDAVKAMADAMHARGGKLAHVSTDFVFDGESSLAYRPDDKRNPLSVYGRTKALGEDALHPSDLLVRTSWVYAAGSGNFVSTMLRLMRERDEIKVVSDQIGSPTWASGLANTIIGLLGNGASGTYHHSDAGVASWYDFAVAIAEEAQALNLLDRIPKILPITTAEYPTPAVRPKFSLLDCRATLAELGENPRHWRHNLRLMLEEEAQLD